MEWATNGWRSSPYAKTEVAGFGIDVDGLYGFQCKDFVQAYSISLGAPFTNGNAITLLNPQPGWVWTISPHAGDVFVRNAYFKDEYGVTRNFGDTGIIESVTPTGVNVIQQNLKADLQHGSPPAPYFWAFSQLIGYLRIQGGQGMTQDGVEKYVSKAYRVATDIDATPEQAQYWVTRIMADNNTAYELCVALGADDYKGDPQFRYKGRHYDEDMKTKYQQGLADGGSPATTLKPGKYVVL